MSVRLETFQSLGRNLKDCCRQTIPLICLARYLSDRPVDWFFFWIGWRFLSSSTAFLSGKNYFLEARATRVVDHRNHDHNTECCFQKENEAATAIVHRTSTAVRKQQASASATEITHSYVSLTSLPSVVLSNVGCYLHARDLLALDTVIRSDAITRTGNLRDSVDGSNSGNDRKTRQMHMHNEAILHDVWKLLWYRDYGDALLRWKVAREAFRRSLVRATLSPRSTEFIENNNKHDNTDDDDDDDKWVEEQLSIRLDEMTKMPLSNTTMKDFYFLFGECYVDYLLAGKNTVDECYLGLHGHIVDFTDFAEYHPGLIEPILKECGGDATFFFEDLPHSSGARNIAKRLCVLVNHGAINYGNDCCSRSCGLELVRDEDEDEDDDDSSELKRILRSSNTRPPPPVVARSSNNKNKRVDRDDDRNRWMPHIFPRRRQPRRHPTLEKIRTRFQQEQLQHQHEQHQHAFVTSTSRPTTNYSKFWKQQQKQSVPTASSKSRVYYDPLLQKWIRWNP
mmetsp:Transcript_24632/g.53992  ORF Transcript_24632/g.53992 Transcript_24632/m.53992 type:complete len:509 (+) Transcript_24632:286-1812(+)